MFRLIIIFSFFFILLSCSNEIDKKDITLENQNNITIKKTEKIEQLFISDNLKTNTSKSSIDLGKILDWWPWKNWIPAINHPVFIQISEVWDSMPYLKDLSYGISVVFDWIARFYPYDILVWHEIINDTIGNKKISVTFCPLCWSAIVFDRIIDWEKVYFWVSWKLYESNLLMFDNINESLWSQSEWEAVVWEYLWTKLDIIKSNLLTLKQFRDKYKSWLVLSDKTWYNRNYWVIPYWDYNTNETLYFPVSNEDIRLNKKEILYIVNDKENSNSLAFVLKDLIQEKKASLKIWNLNYIANYNEWNIDVSLDWNIFNWYYEMWFSWINHNVGSKNIWMKK